MTLDWATVRLLDRLSKTDGRLRRPAGVEDLRALARRLAEDNGPGPDLESVEDVSLPGGAAAAGRLRVFTPRAGAPAVVLYLPGPAWGWVAGTLDTHDTVSRKLAERTGGVFITLETRKAPEHPYPAALEDAWEALSWAHRYRGQLADPATPLILLGEGSGGALATLIARRAARTGGPDIDSVVLVSPCLDWVGTRRSYTRYGDDGLVGRALLEHLRDVYLPDPLDLTNADAVPLRARDLGGVPPTVLLEAEHDPLRDEAHEYLARLASAGVATERHLFPGQMHGFFGILELPLGERAFQVVVRHVRRRAFDGVTAVAA